MKQKKQKILNVPVDITTYDQMLDNIKDAVDKNKKITIMAINPKKIIFSQENKELKKALENSSYCIPDGYQVVRLIKELKERVTGIDLMQKICEHNKNIKARIFLYGSKEENVVLVKQHLEEKYPNIEIVGYSNGYRETTTVIEEINHSKANIVFVGLGSPKQEIWMHENKNKIKANVIMGVGGSFDVLAGQVKRAPVFLQKMGLEWLYRFIKQPKKMKEIPIYVKYLKLVKKEVKK